MPIDNGQIADANEVKAVLSRGLYANAQSIFNSSYNTWFSYINSIHAHIMNGSFGHDGKTWSTLDADYLTLLGSKFIFNINVTNGSTAVGGFTGCQNGVNLFGMDKVSGAGQIVYAINCYDFMEGTTYDSTKWTFTKTGSGTATITQSDNQGIAYTMNNINGTNGLSIKAKGSSNQLNLKPVAGTTSECFVHVSGSTSASVGSGITFRIIDSGGTSVTIFNQSSTSCSLDRYYRFVISGTTMSVRYYASGQESNITSLDISSLGGSYWYLELITTATSDTSGSQGITFNPIWYANGSALASTDFVTGSWTAPEDITNIFPVWNTQIEDGVVRDTTGITCYTSTNGGSDYTATPANTFTSLTSGTSMRHKFNFTSAQLNSALCVTEYGFYYNPWTI